MIEYKLCWSASSNHSFRGETEWEEWGGFEETTEEVEAAIYDVGEIGGGLQWVLEASGLEWWAEVRDTNG